METTVQDDFFEAVNGEWEAQAVIPDDKPRTGGFTDLSDEIEKLMLATTDQWLEGTDVPNDSVLQNFVKLHRLAADQIAREKVGLTPVKAILAEYEALDSFQAFTKKLVTFERQGKTNAMPFGVAPDFKNAQMNVLWADALSTILPDTTYYAADNEKGQELLLAFRETTLPILKRFGYSEQDSQKLLDDTIAYDAKIAKYVLSNEEGSEYAKLYHPYEWAEFVKFAPELPLTDFMTAMLGKIPDQIIVPEERFWQHATEFYSATVWPQLKAYLLVSIALDYTGLLTEDMRVLGGAYHRIVSGTPEPVSRKKAAFYLAAGPYNQALGLWYAGEKFSAAAKADVEQKVATMIDVYKDRLGTADWLAPETRQQAIVKLDAIVPHIGYPDRLPARFYDKVIDSDLTLFDNFQKLSQLGIAYAWSKWHQPVDKTEWHMPAHMVNAYYDPQQNQIVFPAAILQAPFYDLNQSSSANYGGIGAVIAHEISHAFDTNGAAFDEHGSLNNWWTDADYQAFEARTKAVVEQFDGQLSYGAKVNGKLTVSENVADLGGLAAALTAAKREPDFSAEQFFINWATIWRLKARPEFMQMMASVDVHAPAKLRVNIQVANFDDFFTTFNIQSGDQMWRDPKQRLMIW
ncbi:endopeptidase [Weissella diestrammenae]|uniref:Endopeptidase n=1 Tax=Weissella diestrammenae TaxID=1162633 RepID=A0A7G9T3H8_9LACO|nr:M13-type metalloendopeptidase [Weissella diestrammenae]MCM0582624.1 endopeptidase [Weissella diestrammenae]QNN74653.1 endopeptidase [Weissella diestrammenae]